MIIRRKHTANFTTIGNVLFHDERLEADEVGIIAYLLSMPHDWEVRRPALQRRWRVGRDSIKRIIRSAMRTGWIVARKTRLSNGTFHIVYEVRDEPGPELSADEIKAALSLVSSDAGQDESSEGDRSDHPDDPLKPPTENPSWSAAQPLLARPSPADPPVANKILQNPDLQRKESTKGARDFVDVKEKWPADNVLSEVASQHTFLALSDAEKEGCFSGLDAYLSDCKSQNRKVCDLTTYIRERRWERFSGKAGKPQPAQFKIRSPQWFRWREYKLATRAPTSFMDKYARENPNGTWTEPTEWPPAIGGDDLKKTG